MSNHDNAQPLTADEIAAIQQQMTEYRAALDEYAQRTYLDPDFRIVSDILDIKRLRLASTVPALLAHVAAVDARCRAYEAALRVIAAHGDDRNLSVMRSTWTTSDAYSDVKEMAADALVATDGSGRDGNGEAR